ncbi:MAG TPA: pantoate--beta-alanine ligase [Acidisphaera sp.]|nr:pantoate--beta-alanine ligase [Acidisphaera sp.]
MQIARTQAELDDAVAGLRERAARIGFVPTMGALHAGHRALVDAARTADEGIVASIFVNPTQFGPNEDFSRYPRDEAGDLALLREAGCGVVWMPDVATMYPPEMTTRIDVGGPSEGWEGTARPGHFRGVATVVTRLFGQVRPDRAYFGEKDWQQLQVVRRMVADLRLPVEVVGVPTVRDPDGLALSSRNRYLTDAERTRAPLLYASLREAARNGATPAALAAARQRLTDAGMSVEYLELVDGPTLVRIEAPTRASGMRLIAAARLGSVRLLDNIDV